MTASGPVRARGLASLDPGTVATLLLCVTLVFWGGSFRGTAIAAAHTTAPMLSALRAVIAGLVLLALVPLLRLRLPRGRAWIWAAVTGLLVVTLFYEGLAEGTARAGAGNAAVLINTTPFFVLILGRILLAERASWLGLGGLVVGFAGVVVMVSSQLGGADDAGDLVLGMGLALAAALAFAITTLVMKWLVVREPELDLIGFTTAQSLIGAAGLVALTLGLEGTGGGAEWSSGDLWGALAFLALGSSALATLAYYGALKRVSATRAAAWTFLVPVVAVLVEVALGDTPEPVVLAGMALAIAGVGLVNFAPQLEARRARLEGEVATRAGS